jgi:hypothetical protein
LSELLTQEAELLVFEIERHRVEGDARLAVLRYHTTLGTLDPSLVANVVRSTP